MSNPIASETQPGFSCSVHGWRHAQYPCPNCTQSSGTVSLPESSSIAGRVADKNGYSPSSTESLCELCGHDEGWHKRSAKRHDFKPADKHKRVAERLFTELFTTTRPWTMERIQQILTEEYPNE